MSTPEFSSEEFDICLKVLQQVADDPSSINTHDRFKALVAKIHKTGKKKNRPVSTHQKTPRDPHHDRKLEQNTTIVRSHMHGSVLTERQSSVPEQDANQLYKSVKCYICKRLYRKLHFFYHQLCPTCADVNFQKRHQRSDLTGRTALVTGARIKIGYQTALRLLQDGATVLLTTRFPQDAALRFSREPDFEQWHDRLQIHGLDLRNLPAVESFTQHLLRTQDSLDILIHNAAQTIKRPIAFYQALLKPEQSLPPMVQRLLSSTATIALLEQSDASGLVVVDRFFPANTVDSEGQPIDLRPINSWILKLDEVETVELLEVHLVNAIAPFILNNQLKSLMLRSPHNRRFIINVSAMEGQFNREHKTVYHPHTNMAKAALNMMTRTSASDYTRSGIYMNSVDTGWVTDENPHGKRTYDRDICGFYPPLDIIDGMARIYDPIAQGVSQREDPIYGHFLKDYQPCDW